MPIHSLVFDPCRLFAESSDSADSADSENALFWGQFGYRLSAPALTGAHRRSPALTGAHRRSPALTGAHRRRVGNSTFCDSGRCRAFIYRPGVSPPMQNVYLSTRRIAAGAERLLTDPAYRCRCIAFIYRPAVSPPVQSVYLPTRRIAAGAEHLFTDPAYRRRCRAFIYRPGVSPPVQNVYLPIRRMPRIAPCVKHSSNDPASVRGLQHSIASWQSQRRHQKPSANESDKRRSKYLATILPMAKLTSSVFDILMFKVKSKYANRKAKSKYANRKLIRNITFASNDNVCHIFTILKIVSVEMCTILTFRIGQCQIKIC